jgi:hypothetical protein
MAAALPPSCDQETHGTATSRFGRGLQQRHRPDRLYFTKLGDVIKAGPLQLARHVSRYAESTFSQFCQEYLLDNARTIWWESYYPDNTHPPPSLDTVLPRFFDRLKSMAMAHAWEIFPSLAVNPNRARVPRIMKTNYRTNRLSVGTRRINLPKSSVIHLTNPI